MKTRRTVSAGHGLGAVRSAQPFLVALLAALAFVLHPEGPARGADAFRDFEFLQLNRTYQDLPAAAYPIQRSLFTIQLSSPNQEVVLARHRLRLRPRGDGTHDAELWAQFSGNGRMYADVSAGGFAHRFQDDVELPLQTQTLQGQVRISRTQEGYLITTVELPREAKVQLKSRLGGEILGWCETLAAVPFSPFECAGLDRALSSASVPLPPPGDTYLLSYGDLAPEDRKRLDAYLAAAGTAAPPPKKDAGRTPGR